MTMVIIPTAVQSVGVIAGAATGMMPAVRGTVMTGRAIKPIKVYRTRRAPRCTREGDRACPVRNSKMLDGNGAIGVSSEFYIWLSNEPFESLTAVNPVRDRKRFRNVSVNGRWTVISFPQLLCLDKDKSHDDKSLTG